MTDKPSSYSCPRCGLGGLGESVLALFLKFSSCKVQESEIPKPPKPPRYMMVVAPTGFRVSYQPVFRGIWRSDRRAA
jgi:hypothetical protein